MPVNGHGQKGAPSRRSKSFSPYLILSHLVLALTSFQMGLFFGGHSCGDHAVSGAAREETVKGSSPSSTADTGESIFLSEGRKLVEAAAFIDRDDFISAFDYGMPWDETKPGNKFVMMLYNNGKSIPTGHKSASASSIPILSASKAAENCGILKVVQLQPNQENHCVALVGQWESYHIQKLVRTDQKANFTYAPRGYKPGGRKTWLPKAKVLTDQHGYGTALRNYLEILPLTLKRLEPIVSKAGGKDKTVVVMVCNFGQSELLVNFVCAARARGLDLSRIILFATDKDIISIAESLGINVFDVDDAFGTDMPVDAARMYGDKRFAGMMMAKVYCVHLVNMLGYDLLFQDVDIVWYKDPIPFFHNKELAGDYDLYFQDDGARTARYFPYSPNSGFYYVVHNDRTEYLFSTFARMGDLIQQSGSHQSALNALISEFASLRGLRVKVYARDSKSGQLFPGGFHYHQRKNFMREFVKAKDSAYIFHMSWTKNKDNKIKFLQQMEDWYVKDECIHKKLNEISGLDASSGQAYEQKCCSAEPLFKCHFRDKPSSKECKDSPPIDKGKQSFWN